MRIGIDISRIAAQARTGTEQYTYELLAALGRRDRRNQYRLYTNQRPSSLPPLLPNFALRPIPQARLWTHGRLSLEVALHPPDTLFIPAHVIPLGARLARHTRLVVTIHDLGYLHFPAAHTRMQRLQLRLTTAWSVRIADAVIAISQATKDDLCHLIGVPAEKITVVHHGVAARYGQAESGDQPSVATTHQPLIRQIGQQPYFLYVGTLQPRKNLVRLIEAFALATKADPQWRLVIVGKRGWLNAPIERRVAELGLGQRVLFPGYLSDSEVRALLAGATAFSFPSLYEGFGMPVLEAMAAGIPVLTSTTSALPEVAGDAALLVDPQNTHAIAAGLSRLATDPDLRRELRTRGLARAALFTWDRCADQTLQVLTNG